MESMKVSILSVVCAGIVFSLGLIKVAHGQAGTNASMTDKHFVSEALKGGMAEVQMGQLATEKGNSTDVRDFGKKMVEDHSKLGDQMKAVAGQIGVTVPTSPTMVEQAEIQKLKGLSGDEFDQEYIKTMMKDHEEDLQDFKKEANTGTSSKVKNAASQEADVVSQHLQMIRGVAQAHNISGKSSDGH
jgi:putative membrane protein